MRKSWLTVIVTPTRIVVSYKLSQIQRSERAFRVGYRLRSCNIWVPVLRTKCITVELMTSNGTIITLTAMF